MKSGRIDIISMGCSKNLIDSERLMKQLALRGYDTHIDAEDVCGEYVVVNTCGFIGDAKEESVNIILQLAHMAKERKIGKLVVMGCLSQRYMQELKAEIPEVDTWFGKFDWSKFADMIPQRKAISNQTAKPWDRILSTPKYSAFLKISEGCDRFCAFCAIPLITGRHKSRPIEEILEETAELVSRGVKEFNIIAQDLSSYGKDLYGKQSLAELIDRMANIPGVEWIRLHYAYPSDFPYDLLPVMAAHSNVCKYLDVALQHCSDNILANMRRHINKQETIDFIERIRHEVPGIKIRTTLMVGYPGETEDDFNELIEFVKEMKFDRMGAFAYSEEDDTYAALHFKDEIPQEEKERRLDILMAAQHEIGDMLADRMIGKEVRVLVERFEGNYIIGRTEFDSPEVDPEIYVRRNDKALLPQIGDFITARVTSSREFDLYAEQL